MSRARDLADIASTASGGIEGTEIKSTGESGGSKFLREDGDNSCSWQTVVSVPTGTIFSMAFTPDSTWLSTNGYLICDGSAVSRSTYSALFSAISTTWGTGDGSSTFNIPDLEGAFLRGTGTGTINSRDKAGPSVGAFQEDELQAHAHKISGFTGTGSGGSDKLYAVNYTTPYGGQQIHWMGHTFMEMKTGGGGSQTVRSNDETFPYNAGVQYIIKF